MMSCNMYGLIFISTKSMHSHIIFLNCFRSYHDRSSYLNIGYLSAKAYEFIF